MPLISCQNLSFAYEGITVVSDLNFVINKQDFLFIMGENGTGKTTLINGLLKLMPPKTGSIDIQGLRPVDIGYLPQQTATQKDFPAGVFEVVMSGYLARSGLRPFYSSKEKAQAEIHMDCLGIHDLKNKCFRELSVGEQRKVLLARALCAADKMLLLDEPTAGLDPIATQGLYDLLSEINRTGTTIVVVSHDIHGANAYASHILHLGEETPYFGAIETFRASKTGAAYFGDCLRVSQNIKEAATEKAVYNNSSAYSADGGDGSV